jgi:hypothetical protein
LELFDSLSPASTTTRVRCTSAALVFVLVGAAGERIDAHAVFGKLGAARLAVARVRLVFSGASFGRAESGVALVLDVLRAGGPVRFEGTVKGADRTLSGGETAATPLDLVQARDDATVITHDDFSFAVSACVYRATAS